MRSRPYVSSHDEAEILVTYRFDPEVRIRTEKLLAQQYEIAKGIVESRRREVDALTAALINRGSLSGSEITEILKGPPGLSASDAEADKDSLA
ncbi:hypothetical protein [Phyllobacterium sp. K27]